MTVSSLLRLFFFFFTFFLFIKFVDGQCLDDQKKLLLDLNGELVLTPSISPRFVQWNETDDCCEWDGVDCDDSGRVTGLSLIGNDIWGRISGGIGDSSSLFRFRYLSQLDLSRNALYKSQIPNQFHRLANLTYLDLSGAGFMGPIPSTLANLTHLVDLDLSSNFLTSSIPSFHLCNQLKRLRLQDNNLRGSLSHFHFQGLTNLVILDLSGNRIEGPIPNSFFQLPNLFTLRLSHNLFSGTFQLQKIQTLPQLFELGLSYNNLSVETINMSSSSHGYPQLGILHLSSCNLYDFPILRNQSNLFDLELSNNHIGGDIPSWIWESQIMYLDLSVNFLTNLQKPYNMSYSLKLIDLHSNQLRFEFPLLLQAIHFDRPSEILPGTPDSPNVIDFGGRNSDYLLLADNSLTGVIPTSICNASSLSVLDLSFNSLSGSIPPCLLKENIGLEVLNLRGNNINGVIPDQFSECGLQTFDVSHNNLGGKVPKSMENCQDLVVMNVGNNIFDDNFPCMLPLSLHILVLRSNRFHGNLTCHKSWPRLQILDISSNNFSGTLDPLNLSRWRGMMLESPAHVRPNRSDSDILSPNEYYRDEVTITVKKVEVKLVKIWPDFTSIDVSSNNFEGEIPDAIGNLSSLYLLNLSNNALTGAIPKSLGSLTELGSLDLSVNQLRGRIPSELAKLTFLSVLNVSYNDLTGMIPTGPQFQTFSADAFEGNTGLCGFPLDRSCGSPHGPGSTPSKSKDDEEIEWEYVFAEVGYVVGLGSIAWTLLCCRSLREIYFEKIEEVVDKIFYERGRRRRHERRVRRRAERRNVVRSHHQ